MGVAGECPFGNHKGVCDWKCLNPEGQCIFGKGNWDAGQLPRGSSPVYSSIEGRSSLRTKGGSESSVWWNPREEGV